MRNEGAEGGFVFWSVETADPVTCSRADLSLCGILIKTYKALQRISPLVA
jgi:hypothetical protein